MQRSETQDCADSGTFHLAEAPRVAPQHVELLTSKDEDFSSQSTHHRNSPMAAHKINPQVATWD
jgi:hypothetical protein